MQITSAYLKSFGSIRQQFDLFTDKTKTLTFTEGLAGFLNKKADWALQMSSE